MKKTIIPLLLALTIIQTHAETSTNVTADTKQVSSTADVSETKEQRDARMAWWRDAKFGMFIHWGVYSVPAGYYHDKPISGVGEWIFKTAKIPLAEYHTYACQFTGSKFDADHIAQLAQDAGMKYLVITAKHHDGFAMYPTKVSPWNIKDASGWTRDPLAELAAACKKRGIKFGLYYSQAQDWYHGGAVQGQKKWDPAQERDMDDYLDKVCIPQLKEIFTNYGPEVPAMIWFDTPADMTPARSGKIYDLVKKLKPDVVINSRLGGGFKGDTEVHEENIPPQGYPGTDWETCGTLNGTWGYKRDSTDFRSTEVLLHNLVDIVSKGGNYLLNVGPDSAGLVPEAEVDRLEAVGQWLKVNGEAIYGSSTSPFNDAHFTTSATEKDKKGNPIQKPIWDWRATSKPGKVSVIIFNWPKNGTMELPPLASKVTKTSLLADHTELKFTQTDKGITLQLPKEAPDKIASVICLNLKK